jgi:hypothetical protein
MQKMIQVNEDAKIAMDAAQNDYFVAVNDLYEAESNKEEALMHLQQGKQKCRLATAAGGFDARLQQNYDRVAAEKLGIMSSNKRENSGPPLSLDDGGAAAASSKKRTT